MTNFCRLLSAVYPMPLTNMDNIKDYEAMAELDLPEDERRQISAWADMLIGSFEAMKSIDTDAVEPPLSTVLAQSNVLREDVSVKVFSREEILANAPMQYDGYFQVPKTF